MKSSGLPDEVWDTIAKESQSLVIRIERRRWGKKVTVLEGLDKGVDGGELATKLKKKLACGGTFKEGHIELQGDHKRRLPKILVEMGFPEDSIEVK